VWFVTLARSTRDSVEPDDDDDASDDRTFEHPLDPREG
jgi:hypothetical protein